MIDRTINSMNEHRVNFTTFAGDRKKGHSVCTDQAIGQAIVDIFDSLDATTLYTLGDNEWTDGHRTFGVKSVLYRTRTFQAVIG